MSNHQGTVLIVEDDQVNMKFLSTLLDSEGYSTLQALNGQTALSILEESSAEIQAVLLDWMLPDFDGLQVLEHMQKDSALRHIPVIMQTAKTRKHDFLLGMESGVYQYLTKPFEGEVLLSMVRSAVRSYDQHLETVELLRGSSQHLLQEQELSLSSKMHESISRFIVQSLDCQTHEALTQVLLNCVKEVQFDSAEPSIEAPGKWLRCNVQVVSQLSIHASDRDWKIKLDEAILKRALEEKQVVNRGSYTVIPSHEGLSAVMIRNTPMDPKEREQAIQLILTLLEVFDGRLLLLERDAVQSEHLLGATYRLLESVTSQIRESFSAISVQSLDSALTEEVRLQLEALCLQLQPTQGGLDHLFLLIKRMLYPEAVTPIDLQVLEESHKETPPAYHAWIQEVSQAFNTPLNQERGSL